MASSVRAQVDVTSGEHNFAAEWANGDSTQGDRPEGTVSIGRIGRHPRGQHGLAV